MPNCRRLLMIDAENKCRSNFIIITIIRVCARFIVDEKLIRTLLVRKIYILQCSHSDSSIYRSHAKSSKSYLYLSQ